MIVLCPHAFAGVDSQFERDFLRYFLIVTKQHGIVANEVWDAWRFRIKRNYPQQAETLDR